jgi:DNA-binding protein Fis
MSDGQPSKQPRLKDRLESICAEMIERGILFSEAVTQFEKCFIAEYLKRSDGNLTRAAAGLSLHRNTLAKKIQVYKLRKPL